MYTVRIIRRSQNNSTSDYKFERRGLAVDFIRSINGFIVGNTIARIRTMNLYIVGLK